MLTQMEKRDLFDYVINLVAIVCTNLGCDIWFFQWQCNVFLRDTKTKNVEACQSTANVVWVNILFGIPWSSMKTIFTLNAHMRLYRVPLGAITMGV